MHAAAQAVEIQLDANVDRFDLYAVFLFGVLDSVHGSLLALLLPQEGRDVLDLTRCSAVYAPTRRRSTWREKTTSVPPIPRTVYSMSSGSGIMPARAT